MQVSDGIEQHEDFDNDSLFGSPPPSPGRGRSSSPLALPGGQNSVQNVGTLALPGSHLCSELPSAPPAPSINTCSGGASRQRSQPPRSVWQAPPPRPATVPPSPVIPPIRSGPVAQKRKRPSRRSTTATERRPSPPPIALPSPTDPPPVNFLRNQQALLGHAGLISGVNPANLALQRHLRGKTPHNPIVVEEEDERPASVQRSFPSFGSLHQLPVPSSHEILSNLAKQKNLVPVVNALVRLVAGSPMAPPTTGAHNPSFPAYFPPFAAGSSSPGQPPYYYPYQPYSYAYPYYYPYPYGYTYPYAASGYQQPAAPYTSGGAPPPKKRRLSNVPAGASDWDVPYPFPEGQGPPGYHQNWQRQRGQQLVEDLVGLVKSAVKKAVVQKAQEGTPVSMNGHALGSVEYYKERVLRCYRPYAGYEAQSTSRPAPTSTVPPMASLTPGSTSTAASASNSNHEEPADFVTKPAAPSPKPAPSGAHEHEPAAPDDGHSSISISPHVSPQAPEAVLTPPETNNIVPNQPEVPQGDVLSSLSQNPGENIDDLLSIFNDLPVGELDALLDSTDFSTCIPEDFDFSSLFDVNAEPQAPADAPSGQSGDALIPEAQPAEPTDSKVNFNFDLQTFTSTPVIDPELLTLSDLIPPSSSTAGPSEAPIAAERPHVQTAVTVAPSMGSGAPPTPTLVGSPSSQVDFDPPTPNWDLAFLEPEVAGAGAEATPRARASSERGFDLDGCGDDGHPTRKDKGKGRAVELPLEIGVGREDTPIIVEPPSSVLVPPQASTVASSRASSSGAPSAGTHSSAHSQSPAPFDTFEVLEPLRKTLEALLPQPSRVSSLLVAPPVANPRPVLGTANPPKDRDDILRRARLMREQLAQEIERAKIELWETAMEGGCLAVLTKERDKLIAETK